MKREKELAMNMKNSISVDPSDCRIITIATNDMAVAMEGIEILEKALDLFHNTPNERITSFTEPQLCMAARGSDTPRQTTTKPVKKINENLQSVEY